MNAFTTQDYPEHIILKGARGSTSSWVIQLAYLGSRPLHAGFESDHPGVRMVASWEIPTPDR